MNLHWSEILELGIQTQFPAAEQALLTDPCEESNVCEWYPEPWRYIICIYIYTVLWYIYICDMHNIIYIHMF